VHGVQQGATEDQLAGMTGDMVAAASQDSGQLTAQLLYEQDLELVKEGRQHIDARVVRDLTTAGLGLVDQGRANTGHTGEGSVLHSCPVKAVVGRCFCHLKSPYGAC
jgi:hypothetical protein